MKEAFEKIIDELKQESIIVDDDAGHRAVEIIHQIAEEYSNGWIPISDRFPENDKYILLSFDNFSMPMIGRYESYESGGAFYIGDEDITCSKQDLFVNAWQPLPEPYQPKGE